MVNIGIIGTGTIAHSHTVEINQNLDLTLAAVCDVDEDQGRHVASETKCTSCEGVFD